MAFSKLGSFWILLGQSFTFHRLNWKPRRPDGIRFASFACASAPVSDRKADLRLWRKPSKNPKGHRFWIFWQITHVSQSFESESIQNRKFQHFRFLIPKEYRVLISDLNFKLNSTGPSNFPFINFKGAGSSPGSKLRKVSTRAAVTSYRFSFWCLPNMQIFQRFCLANVEQFLVLTNMAYVQTKLGFSMIVQM